MSSPKQAEAASAESPIPVLVASVFQAVTKTNLPTDYDNIYQSIPPPKDAERQYYLPTKHTVSPYDRLYNQARIFFLWDYVGPGGSTDRVRWVDRGTETQILVEVPAFFGDQYAGDSDWFTIPEWCYDNSYAPQQHGGVNLTMQGKSSNGTNDPICYGYAIYARKTV